MDSEVRQFRLPRTNPFPKLDQRIVARPSNSATIRRTGQPAVIMGHGVQRLPEMATDVIDASAGCAVENVRRERTGTRFGFGQLVERLLGGRHAARP